MPRILFLFVAALLSLPGPALAQGKVTLKFGHLVDTRHPYHLGAEHLAKRAGELSGGRLEVQIFPSSQLGKDRELMEGMQIGTVEMGMPTAPVASQFVAELKALDMPFLFRDFAHLHAYLDGPLGEEIRAAALKRGVRILAFYTGGTRGVYARKPIPDLASLKGLKIRTIEAPIVTATWRALGTIPTPIPFAEVYSALQQGVTDGGEGNIITYLTTKLDEVAPYVLQIRYLITVSLVGISESAWNKLPPELRKAVAQAAAESQALERKVNAEAEDKVVEQLRAKGRTVAVPTDLAPFQNAVKPVYEQYGKEVGLDRLKRIQDIR